MFQYEYEGEMVTIHDLSEMSGIRPATIRYRLRNGYSVEEAIQLIPTDDSVKWFCTASWHGDWIGKPIAELHEIYTNWCYKHGHKPIHIQRFSMQIMRMYPNLKVTSKRTGKNKKCTKVIIER